jgi:hypothetical protein
MARVPLPQSKLRARRRIARVRITIALGVLVVLLLGILVGLSWIPYGRITTVIIAGVETVASSSVEVLVKEKISGTYFFTFPKNNIFLYPKKQIVAELLATYPAAKDITVHAENFQAIKVEVVERHPAALWCGENTASQAACMLMDENGFAYAPAANFSGDAYFSYYGSATSSVGYLAEPTPKQFLTEEQFRSLAALAKAFADNQTHTRITRVVVDPNDDVHLSFANGFTVLFVLVSRGGDVFERFTLALASAPFLTRLVSDFEYLDLRFGDKLYYRLK